MIQVYVHDKSTWSKQIYYILEPDRVWTDSNGPGNSNWKQKSIIGEDSRNSESLLQCRWRSRDEPWMEVGLNSQWKVSIYMSIRQGTFSGRRYSYGTLHFLFLKIKLIIKLIFKTTFNSQGSYCSSPFTDRISNLLHFFWKMF